MNKKPFVSIIIPVFNGDDYLEEAVESALNQTYKNIELIVIDDGSKKYEVFNELKQKLIKQDRVKFLRNKKNYGVSYSLNKAIKYSNGELISWLSHDDRYSYKKIENQINLFNKFDFKTIIYTNTILITSTNKILRKKRSKFEFISKLFNYEFSLLLSDDLHGCSLLIPKQAFIDSGYFNTDLKHIQDYDCWLRIINLKYQFINDKQFNLYSRIHAKQNSNEYSEFALLEKTKFYTDYLEKNKKKFNLFKKLLLKISFKLRGYKGVFNYLKNN